VTMNTYKGNIFKSIVLSLFALLIAATPAMSQKSGGYKFTFKMEGLTDTAMILAKYFAGKTYLEDTAVVKNETFVFEGDEMLDGGIYLVAFPDRTNYFEFIVSEKESKFTMSTTKQSIIKDMKVTGSEENRLFYDYQQKSADIYMDAQKLRAEYDSLEDKKSKRGKELFEELSNIDQKVKSYKEGIIKENPEALISKVFLLSQDPVVPEDKDIPEDVDKDEYKMNYYRSHYLDHVDFTDDRLLLTPVLSKKLEYYITTLTPQIPDSINQVVDGWLAQTDPEKALFKYIIQFVTNKYETSKVMGMDAVFVHMANEYYCNDKVYWLDSNRLAKVCERSETLEPLLMNKIAPNIILPDLAGKWHDVHAMDADYKIMYFWSPTCGHCKKATPKLSKMKDTLAMYGATVVGVCTELQVDKMADFIKNFEIDFLNISDTEEIHNNPGPYIANGQTTLNSLNFRTVYDLYSTPQIYILNKENKIIAKKLGVEQLPDFLKKYTDNEKKKTKG